MVFLRNVDQSNFRVLIRLVAAGVALGLAFMPATGFAQNTTDTDGLSTEGAQPSVGAGHLAVTFEEQSKALTGVYPVALDKMAQVVQNSYNWGGLRDASLACEIGFTAQAIVVRGKIIDDQPFVQPIAYPAKPDWWQTTYAADGLELTFEDPASAKNRLRLILNFSSAGLAPKIQILEAPLVKTAGILTSADLAIKSLTEADVPANLPDPAIPISGFRFETAIPTTGLAEPRFFSGPLRMSVRLHDLDGPIETYLKMEEVIEKRE